MLAAYRLLLTTVLLLPLFIRDFKRKYAGGLRELFNSAFWPGTILGAHFITWIIGARLTPGANATLIVSLVPLVMPIFMLMLYHEKINKREVIATGFALAGMLILSASDFNTNQDFLIGDVVCLISMVLFGFYLALGKRSGKYDSIWLYVVPIYLVAGLFCFVIALFHSSPIHSYDTYEISMIVGLSVVPTIIGHSVLNYSMQKIRGQTVSIVNMGQFVFAGFMAYIMYQEIPTIGFYGACLVFIVSIILVLYKPPKMKT